MPISTTPLYTQVDGVIDTSANSRITINHGMIREPDQYTIIPTVPVGGVTFTLVSKDATQIIFDVHGPRQIIPWKAILTVNHSIIDGITDPGTVSYATGGGPADSSTQYEDSLATLQQGRAPTLLVLDEGRVMVIGGSVGTFISSTASAAVDLWDPVTKTWSALAPLPAPRAQSVAVFLQRGPFAGQVLVVGGADPDFVDPDVLAAADIHPDAWLYNFDTNTWTATGSLPTGQFSGKDNNMVELQNGNVLLVGGVQAATFLPGPPWPVGQGGPAGAAVYSWDPHTELWSVVAPMNEARWGHSTTLLQDGRVLVVAGRDYFNFPPNTGAAVYSQTYEIYDPATDTWTVPVVLPTITDGPTGNEKSSPEGTVPFEEVTGPGRVIHAAARLDDGRVLIFGGYGESSTDPTVPLVRRGCLIFDPTTDTVYIGPNSIRGQVFNPHCTLRGGWVYQVGGLDESNGGAPFFGSPTTQIFSPDEDSWRQVADVPTEFLDRVGIFSVAMCNSYGDVILTGGILPIPPDFTSPSDKTLLYNPVLPFPRSPSES